MSTQITLTVPDDLYRQVKKAADAARRDVSDLLLETVTRSFAPFPIDRNRSEMNKNIAAYRSMHADLINYYLGQSVAIHNGQLVDHDPDPIALLQRVRMHYPNEVVLRRKVEPTAERELQIRHPRIEAVL